MSADKTFLGRRMMDFTSSPAFQAYSRVTLWVDDNNCYTAGDDTGRTLEADCPWATQEICNAVLARVKGYQYIPYTATDAMLDPSSEIGDGVSVNGRDSVIASIEASFDSMFTATVEAPADEELDHEFPYKSSASRAFDRKLAQTRAAITVTADKIMAQVEEELTGLSSSIEQTLKSIKLSVSTKDGVSTFELNGEGITASSAKIDLSGYVTFTGLSGGTTTIDGACIKTGTIDAERINLTGAITFGDLDTDAQNTINGISNTASDAMSKANSAYNLANSITIPNYIKSTYIDSTEIKSPTITGNNIAVYNTFQTIGYDGVNTVVTGYMGATLGQDAYGNDTLGVALSNTWSNGNPGTKYVIVTNAGVRMQAGTHSLTVTANGCYADGAKIGSGTATWG